MCDESEAVEWRERFAQCEESLQMGRHHERGVRAIPSDGICDTGGIERTGEDDRATCSERGGREADGH